MLNLKVRKIGKVTFVKLRTLFPRVSIWFFGHYIQNNNRREELKPLRNVGTVLLKFSSDLENFPSRTYRTLEFSKNAPKIMYRATELALNRVFDEAIRLILAFTKF